MKEKLKLCDENLSFLKQNANELTNEFSTINEKVKVLDQSIKNPELNESNIERILLSLSNQHSSDENSYLKASLSTYNDVNRRLSGLSCNDTASEASSNYASTSSESSDDDEFSFETLGEDKVLNENCNKIIKMLLHNSTQNEYEI